MKLIWSQKSQNDIIGIRDYFLEIDKEKGLEIINSIQEKSLLLLEHPFMGREMSKTIRELFISKYPYSIIYQYLYGNINIITVRHNKQNY
jgi:plasmid stabilization system protein ParE